MSHLQKIHDRLKALEERLEALDGSYRRTDREEWSEDSAPAPAPAEDAKSEEE